MIKNEITSIYCQSVKDLIHLGGLAESEKECGGCCFGGSPVTVKNTWPFVTADWNSQLMKSVNKGFCGVDMSWDPNILVGECFDYTCYVVLLCINKTIY